MTLENQPEAQPAEFERGQGPDSARLAGPPGGALDP